MKHYPSIAREIKSGIHIFAFDKLDGNNIRAEWNPKQGFYKFGSRKQLIDESNSQLGKSIPLIREKYEDDLSNIFKKNKWKNVVCFFEYYGPNSFAGQHVLTEEQTVTLFDINLYKQGLLSPREFIKTCRYLDTPKLLYEGKVDQNFINDVKECALKGMTFEGVVCKGTMNNKLIMFKIKSNAWLDKLRAFCNGDVKLFEELK